MAMTDLGTFQNRFAAALFGAPAEGFGAQAVHDIPLERRMDVYRNNVHASLIDALAAAFPVVQKLVGVEFFRAMARAFLGAHMPRSRTLIGFGDELPAFLDPFPPVATLPYLGDVARLELLWLRSYHASNEAALGAADFDTLSETEMETLRLTLHPSVQVMASAHPVLSIWQANQDGQVTERISQQAEAVLVLRTGLKVELHAVDPSVVCFVEAMADGEALSASVEKGLALDPSFDPSHALGLLIGRGGFARRLSHG